MKTLEATRPKRNRDGPEAGAPALDHRAPALVQAPITEWSTPLQRFHRADRNAYIICYIWSSESRDINERTPNKRAAGLIGPKLDFGPLRPMCILMRYSGKFSTTSPAEPKRHKGGGYISKAPGPWRRTYHYRVERCPRRITFPL